MIPPTKAGPGIWGVGLRACIHQCQRWNHHEIASRGRGRRVSTHSMEPRAKKPPKENIMKSRRLKGEKAPLPKVKLQIRSSLARFHREKSFPNDYCFGKRMKDGGPINQKEVGNIRTVSAFGRPNQDTRKLTSACPNQKPALNLAATSGALLFRILCPMDGSLG